MSQTLHSCLNRKAVTYDKQSLEYKERLTDLEDLLVDTGLPVTFVNNEKFRKAYRRLDPKFVVPGMSNTSVANSVGVT